MPPLTDNEGPAFDATEVWDALKHLEPLYPGFEDWYWNQVLPGCANGTRRVFTSRDETGLNGLVIAKNNEEKKLSTIFSSPRVRGGDVASRLMLDAMRWLGTRQPLVTVPESRMEAFLPLANKFGFDYCDVLDGHYGAGRVEHIFNSRL